MSQKLILVIGATGAQGIAVIKALLAPADDGTPSPYAVRALTRDPSSKRAQDLGAQGVELFKGSFEDFASVAEAFKGTYGAWVNTDSFTVGEEREIYAGIKIFEIAKRTPSVRHYVWSSLEYASKKGGFDPRYHSAHHDAKGIVGEYLKMQPSVVSDTELSWTAVSTGPYMEMLQFQTLGPINRRADGTFVFASTMTKGHVPIIALADLGWWARYTFDHRAETSAKDLEIASEYLTWPDLVETFKRVTGQPAVFLQQTPDEWWNNYLETDMPYAVNLAGQPGVYTLRENFTAFWNLFRDDICHRDMAWIRSVHPGTLTVEKWMRDTGYNGILTGSVLKGYGQEDAGAFRKNTEVTDKL